MKLTIKLLYRVVVVGCFALASLSAQAASLSSGQASSWSITIETNPMSFPCGGKTISVPAANNCADAITVAQAVFKSISSCAPLCPNRIVTPGVPTCKVNNFFRPNGSPAQNFQVSIPYVCGRVVGIDPTRPPCDEAAVMKDGKPVFPVGATDIEAPVDVDEDRGLLSALYPGLNTTTDEFYPLPCEPSIGGTLPADVPPSQDELDAEAYLSLFETKKGKGILKHLKLNPMPAVSQLAAFTIGDCFIKTAGERRRVPCDSPLFLMHDQPFEGRDIIYVHGLATQHLMDKLKNPLPSVHPAHRRWPQDASEYLDTGKYFRTYAEDYWRDHIRENLFDPDNPSSSIAGWQWTSADASPRYNPKSNRYLLVAWSSNQTIEYAQHALLTQIYLAITTNKNVVTPPTYPSTHVRPFCSNGCIIIGHSTGPLVTSSAMGLAKVGFFGPGGKQIQSHIRAHVAFESVLSGSRLATVAMAIGIGVTPVVTAANVLCPILDELFGTTNTCNADTSFVASSILRDLIPMVTQGVWGPWVNASPVQTVTVAGGHPIGNFFGVTKTFLPGLDDGVTSMNSACGNPNPVLPGVLAPSGFTATSLVKAFDFSDNPGRLSRGVKNWFSHKNLKAIPPLPKYLAGACTPYLSPTGMVMPVENAFVGTPWYARKRYANHYSFLQGSIDHSYDGGTDDKNMWPSELQLGSGVTRVYKPFFGITSNTEESIAITNSAIYGYIDGNGTHLVHPAFAQMHEVVRGKKISFKLFGKRRTWWIWKRTYHLLDKWETKQSSHYVYEFVGRH